MISKFDNKLRILVLSNGEIVEYGTPNNLIADVNSEFYKLYSKSK